MFEVNYGACTLCGICVAQCPTGSLGYENEPLDPELLISSLRIDLARQKKNKLVIKGQTPWRDA
jgi:formate hydrogenlyase subunit 6/NADH:ubiquinone oxidoreductase subunit I